MKIINELVDKVLSNLKLPSCGYSVTHPKEESHGDYSINVAMILAKQLGQNPRELAEKIVEILDHYTNEPLNQSIDKIEVAGAGFINFYLKPKFFLEQTKKAIEPGYGENENLKNKKVMVEYTDPNPFKEMHIGHLMSNTIGESLARLLEASGAEVERACYQGDVGLHVAKSIWGMQKKMVELKLSLTELQVQALQERQQFMGQAYAYGAGQYETDEKAKAEMHALNKEIYDGLTEGTGPARTVLAGVMDMYHEGRKWSLEYFESIYQRLGTKFDEYFFESEAGPVGLDVVQEGLDKGVLEVGEEGAVVYKGEKDGMHTRVFRNKLGLPTYEAKDLGLAKTKWERYKYDLSYIVTANEITEYFKVVLRVMEQLYPELRAKTTHIPHGMMKLTTGKMSSRTGVVITGEGLLNDLRDVVVTKMGARSIKDQEKVADQVAVGSLKYTVLRQAVGGDIVYEPEKMTNLEGNTGPFVQYAHARASSILKKFTLRVDPSQLQGINPNAQEMSILRWIYRYPEVVSEAGVNFAPHLVATYIYELAQRFNSFYQACRVEENGEVNELRYLLTQAVANVLKSGLGLLGIAAPAEM
ncbi:MAG: arginine--tRNA ligase [Microgenomates group bacterium]